MSRRFQVAVKALFVNADGQVLLLRRSRNRRLAPGAWDTPGGKMRFGETVESALRREVLEETGMEDFGVTMVLNTWSILKDEATQLVGITFVCRCGDDDIRLSGEHDAFRWADVREFVEAGDQEDSLRGSLLALLRTRASGGAEA